MGASIGSLYIVAMNTGLAGRRGGPQDAFRHTYASALVSKYLSPKIVHFVTWICEGDDSPYDQMDRHNNALGARLGQSESDLYQAVLQKINLGAVNAVEPDTIQWLPQDRWDQGL